jgi:lysozyme
MRGHQHHRLLIWLVSVVIVTALGTVGWFVWLPNYRPSLAAGERYGIDVSHHQGSIDWSRVARDGIGFTYVKATEGSDFTDNAFAENWVAAGDVGMQRGAYHFFSLCSSGADQARHFLSVLPADQGELAPAVDLELADNCSARPTSIDVGRQVETFLSLVDRATGKPTVVYLAADFGALYDVQELSGHPLWIPHFLSRPSDDWTLWQVDGFARVEGVTEKVDLDVMR